MLTDYRMKDMPFSTASGLMKPQHAHLLVGHVLSGPQHPTLQHWHACMASMTNIGPATYKWIAAQCSKADQLHSPSRRNPALPAQTHAACRLHIAAYHTLYDTVGAASSFLPSIALDG